MRDNTEQRRYGAVARFVAETPWAILPQAFATIRELVVYRADGGRYTPEEIAERVGAARPRAAAPRGGSVAVVPLRGPIVPHADLMTEVSGGSSIDGFMSAFRSAMADDAVQAVVLDVDSPGGSVDLVPEAAAEIRAARGRKPIYAVANTDAASAAYWLASQADDLAVSPSGQVGSIGVFAGHTDISAAMAAEGVTTTLIHAGEYKVEESPFQPLTDDARAAIQHRVDAYYRMFVSDVAKGRGVDISTVDAKYGQGRMLVASDALRAGMVDRVATVEDTIRRALGAAPGRTRPRAALDAPEEVELDIPAEQAVAPEAVYAFASPSPLAVEDIVAGIGPFPSAGAVANTTSITITGIPPEPAPPVAAQPGGATTNNTDPQEGRKMRDSEELVARQNEISARQQELDNEYAGQAMPQDAQEEFDNLDTEWETIQAALDNMEERRAKLAKHHGASRNSNPGGTVAFADGAAATGESRTSGGNRNPGATMRRTPPNVFDLQAYRQVASSIDDLPGLYADGARRVLCDHLTFAMGEQDETKEHVERLIASDPTGDFARRVIQTGSPLYERAFTKTLKGHLLNSQEQAVLSLSGGDGLAVPVTIDPTVIVVSNGQVNPMRQLARTVTITGNTWRAITTEGITASYDDELEEVSDDSPSFLSPEATVLKAQAFVPFSIEVDQDWAGLRTELARAFADAKDNLEADKFTNGNGTTEPLGIVTALVAAGTAAGVIVNTSGTAALDLGDLDLLADALPPRFESRATAMASRQTFGSFRALAGDRTDFWVTIANAVGRPGQQILGYPVAVNSEMSNSTSSSEDVLILGDFSQFVIVDRAGLNVELVPHLFGNAGRPIGARGLYCWWRNTSQITTANAFRMLEVT